MPTLMLVVGLCDQSCRVKLIPCGRPSIAIEGIQFYHNVLLGRPLPPKQRQAHSANVERVEVRLVEVPREPDRGVGTEAKLRGDLISIIHDLAQSGGVEA